jgi:GDPmannose 4,6-dehydratase
MPKKALITGIAGQDGSYLAKLLLQEGYQVYGITRTNESPLWRHAYIGITDRPKLCQLDLTNLEAVRSLVAELQPEEIYHLAAQSSVAASLKSPYTTLHFNTISTLNLLETITQVNPAIRFFNVSSSDIFSATAPQPLTIDSPIAPLTPYGVSKASAHLMVQSYRQSSRLFAVNGILFPHESPLRQPVAFTKSLIRQAIEIKNGSPALITLGQTKNKRDFGSAEEFVFAMWQSLQVTTANEYIIGTGTATSITDIAEYVCDKVGIPRTVLMTDSRAITEPITTIVAETTDTLRLLKWSAGGTIYKTLDEMIEFAVNYKDQIRNHR